MALAHLEFEDHDGQRCRFRAWLGSNRYYAYAIGDGETFETGGVRVLRNRTHQSRLFGPEGDTWESPLEFQVPAELFDREHRSIQLITFREPSRIGPAVSSVVEVPLDAGGEDLPALVFSLSQAASEVAMTQTPVSPSIPSRPIRARARVRERQPVSEAMFLQGLVSLLPTIIPAAGEIIGSLLRSSATAPRPAPAAPASPSAPTDPNVAQLLQQLVAAIHQASAAPTAAAPAPAAAAASLSKTAQRGASPGYSDAMVAPALIAALPALMPLLQNVLSPQTIQGVLQVADPNRLIGTVSQAIQGLAQLGIQADQQHMQHLERLNPGVDDPAFSALLQSLSVNLTHLDNQPDYRRVSSVQLRFSDAPTVRLNGRYVVAVLREVDLDLPVSIDSPRPIPEGMFKVVLKDATTAEVIAKAKVRTPPCQPGRIPVPNPLRAEQLTAVKPGQECLLTAHLVWRNSKGEKIGTSMTQAVTFVDRLAFDSITEGGQQVPLNDVDRDRDFWHKVWQGSFERDLARIEFDAKYYYVLDPERASNGQLPTTVVEEEEGVRRTRSKLKSGLFLGLSRLNELLPQLTERPPLSEMELNALSAPEFVRQVRTAARAHVKFSGRPGRSAALWVWPEMRLVTVRLAEANQVDPSGVVRELVGREVRFPVPATVHFVGVQSE